MPTGLKHLHVLAEPMSCAAKAVQQAYEVQRRLKVWRPKLAFVCGAGQIGLLTTLILRLRGLEVYTLARTAPPTLPSEIVTAGGELRQHASEVAQGSRQRSRQARFDRRCHRFSAMSFGAMEVLNLNGVLVWTSITGGQEKHEVPADKLNLEWVLGNKLLLGSVNANREHFEMGIRDLAMAEMNYPGVVQRILTHPVQGLENYEQMMKLLVDAKSA